MPNEEVLCCRLPLSLQTSNSNVNMNCINSLINLSSGITEVDLQQDHSTR